MEHLFTKGIISDFHLKRYLKFVSLYKDIKREQYKEEHHILPRAYYPEFEKDSWNLVDLPYRAHYIAHYLLAKAIGGKMWFAFNAMNNKNRSKLSKLNSILYEVGKENFKIQKKIFNDTIDLETGLTNAQLVGRASAKTKKDTILENGLNIFQDASLRAAETARNTILDNGLTLAQNMVNNAKLTKKNILPNGLTITQNAGLKLSKTRRAIDPETGLTFAQTIGITMAITKTTTFLENGLTLAQDSTRKANLTKQTILPNGLTISQNSSIKAAETRMELGMLRGAENGRANYVKIFNSNDELISECFGNFDRVCKLEGYPNEAFRKSFQNKTKIETNSKFKGWYAVLIGKCRDFSAV